MAWKEGDFSEYHYARDPWYKVSENGKVEIGLERGAREKISLTPQGMMKLTIDWLENMNNIHIQHLDKEDCEKIIELLQNR